MKKLLDAVYLALGTLCLFGLPGAILGFSAWFGDDALSMMHVSASALQHMGTQAELIAVIFGTSAGGLAAALASFAVVWAGAQAIHRAAQGVQAMPVAAGAPNLAAARPGPRPESTVGHMQGGASRRRARHQRSTV